MAAVDLIPFVLILLAFYLLIVRPARNRQRAALQLQEQLAPGVEVVTTSGLYGTVVTVDDSTVHLEIAPGTTVRLVKAAVGQVRSPEVFPATDATDAADGTAGPTGDAEQLPGGTESPTDSRDDEPTR